MNPLLDMVAFSTVNGAAGEMELEVAGGDGAGGARAELGAKDGAAIDGGVGGNGCPEIETDCIARSREVCIGEPGAFSPFGGVA